MADSYWIVLSDEKKKFDSIFDSLGPTGGKLSGDKVKPVLLNSKLSTDILGQVWELSDIDKDGFLDRDEFCVAMHLVYKALEQEPVPAVLPKNLIPPSKRKPALIGAVPVLPPVTSMQGTNPSMGLTAPLSPSSIVKANPASSGAVTHQSKSNLNIKTIVPDIEFTRFSGIFAQKASPDGYIAGSEARDIFVQSALPQQVLAHVWNLCDQQLIGKLDQDQFILAMHFIAQEVKGIKVPAQLPPEVIVHKERDSGFGDSGNLSDSGSSGVGDFSAVRELDALNREIEDLRREKETLTIEIRDKEQTVKKRSSEVQELQNTLDRASTSLSQLESDKAEVHTRIDELDQQQLKLDGMIADNRAKVQEEVRIIAALRAQIEEQELASKKREDEYNRMKSELESLKKEKMQLEQTLSIGEQQLKNITKQVDDTKTEIEKVKEQISALAGQRKTVTSNIEQYDKAVAALRSETEATDEAFAKFGDASVKEQSKDDLFQSSDPFVSQNLFKSDRFAADSSAFSDEKSKSPLGSGGLSDAFGHTDANDAFGASEASDVFGKSADSGGFEAKAIKDVFASSSTKDSNDLFSAKNDPFASSDNAFNSTYDDPFGGSDPFSPASAGKEKEMKDPPSQSSKVFSVNFNDPNPSTSLFNDSENDTSKSNTTDDPWAAFGGSGTDVNGSDAADPFSKDSFLPNPSASFDAFGSNFVLEKNLNNNGITSDAKKMSEDAQLAWASEQSKKMEEERRERRLQEQRDLEYAIKLSKEM